MTRSLESEMDTLKARILSLSGFIESNVKKSVQAVSERNRTLAFEIIASDNQVDQVEVEIEEFCLKILATQQPVASDLRFVIGVLKVNNDLERIGDLAVNIAERAVGLTDLPLVPPPFAFDTMAEIVSRMLKKSLDALVRRDIKLAQTVHQDEQEVNALNREMYTKVYAAVKKSPENVQAIMQYLSISRHLERIGDYCTNIAEDVVYMVEGKIVRHQPEYFSGSV